MTHTDRELAKEIVLEIVRQAGGALENKTNLYKAFYWAHVEFAKRQPGYLSSWQIVRIPHGPGIHGAGELLRELESEGRLRISHVLKGSKVGFRFELANAADSRLSTEAIDAIRAGVNKVKDRTADSVSEESHLHSRSWRRAADGQDLNVYIDEQSNEEFLQREKKLDSLVQLFESV